MLAVVSVKAVGGSGTVGMPIVSENEKELFVKPPGVVVTVNVQV